MRFSFCLRLTRGTARLGVARFGEVEVETPLFMPVATLGAIKGLPFWELRALGYRVVLHNALHLYFRPGPEVVERFGGIKKLTSWDGGLLVDSGGFQLFSLGEAVKVKEEGVEVRSPFDGSLHFFSPESVVEWESKLGVDVGMALDWLVGYPATREQTERAVHMTTRWLERAVRVWDRTFALFGIVQGGFYEDLRRRSCEEVCELDLPGYAVGGLSVGESKTVFEEFLALTLSLMPEDRVRYVMGIGTPYDLAYAVMCGADIFDCVYPTRMGRRAVALTFHGRVNLRRSENRFCEEPIDPECDCPVCRTHSRAYLHHLYKAKELNLYYLVVLHNLHFYRRVMERIKRAVKENTLPLLVEEWRRIRF